MRFTYREIPEGIAGTDVTVAEMNRLVKEGLRNPLIRLTALKIIRDAGIEGRDFAGEIQAVFDWVLANVRYTKDPYKLEMVHSPDVVLKMRAGDCDDMSILLAALLQSLGHQTRFKVISSVDPETFNHVYAQVKAGNRWLSLDATVPNARPGWESPKIYNSKVYELEGEMNGLGQEAGPHPAEVEEIVGRGRAGPAATLYLPGDELLPHITAFLRSDLKDALVMRQVGRRELLNQLEYLMSGRADSELSPVQIEAAITVLSEAIRFIDSNPGYKVDITLKGLAGLDDLGWPLFEKMGDAVKKSVDFVSRNVTVEGETPQQVVVENPPGSPENAPEITVDLQTGMAGFLKNPLYVGGAALIGLVILSQILRKRRR